VKTASKSKTSLNLAVLLLIAKAVLWAAFAVAFAMRQEFLADLRVSTAAVPILMLVDAIGYVLVAWGLSKNPQIVFLVAVPFLIVNAVLAVTDEFGLFDLVVFVLDLVILGLLLFARRSWPPLTEEMN